MLRLQSNGVTLMVAGSTNLGKSTFLNCLFDQEIIPLNQDTSNSLNVYSLNYDSEGIRKKISLIDTPSFGLHINDENTHNDIINYLKQQFDIFLAEESKIRRNPKFEDTRVHCLIYFISPSVYGMKENDINFLKNINGLVNVIPVVGKSDSLTPEEVFLMRKNVKNQILENEIEIYDFEQDFLDKNLEINTNINDYLPFTIINFDDVTAKTRVRNSHSGLINIEDKKNCDFSMLREIILSNYIDNLIDRTANKLYEDYRAEVLSHFMPEGNN
ncbi:septin 3 [Tubulinosema ratisbonensis]|uniref:Septin 3 n=1 Tax=Tubulinosema ratisbonensis TaxID=291195 RepID=A0A437AHZ5_9MICR|nr:septin 3 [Tubulinosema ratisbonensis]